MIVAREGDGLAKDALPVIRLRMFSVYVMSAGTLVGRLRRTRER